jgi:FAD/FMN-containing dehydrogenase
LATQLPEKLSFQRIEVLDYWDAKQAAVQPACRAEPENAEDVAIILKTITQFKCEFAVKSGGHGREAGVSNAENAIVIDFVRLQSVSVASDRKR